MTNTSTGAAGDLQAMRGAGIHMPRVEQNMHAREYTIWGDRWLITIVRVGEWGDEPADGSWRASRRYRAWTPGRDTHLPPADVVYPEGHGQEITGTREEVLAAVVKWEV